MHFPLCLYGFYELINKQRLQVSHFCFPQQLNYLSKTLIFINIRLT
jgi:hypothetical protein